jgi:hypothetical protein
MKAIYRHTPSGDLFAIETDAAGQVIAACGPLPIRSSHLLTFTPSHFQTFSPPNLHIRLQRTPSGRRILQKSKLYYLLSHNHLQQSAAPEN